MAVPKKKRSKSKKRIKRACWKVRVPNLTTCKHCEAKILLHQVCPQCGYYKDKQVIKVKVKHSDAQKDS